MVLDRSRAVPRRLHHAWHGLSFSNECQTLENIAGVVTPVARIAGAVDEATALVKVQSRYGETASLSEHADGEGRFRSGFRGHRATLAFDLNQC